jgi:hypothetical protein
MWNNRKSIKNRFAATGNRAVDSCRRHDGITLTVMRIGPHYGVAATVLVLLAPASTALAWQVPVARGGVLERVEEGPVTPPVARSSGIMARAFSSRPNGTELPAANVKRGLGILTVRNPNDHDLAAKLVDTVGRKTVRFVYVRKREQATLVGIPAGSYRLVFASGDEWDDEQGRFVYRAVYRQYLEDLRFEEEYIGNDVRFVHYRVGLADVGGWTAAVSRRFFEQPHYVVRGGMTVAVDAIERPAPVELHPPDCPRHAGRVVM